MKVETMPSLRWLKIDSVKVPEDRLHSRFENTMDFEESLRANGVIQPIYVFEDEEGVYWLADGQNRLETAKKQGKLLIQAYIMKGSKEDAMLYSAKLNVLRGKVNVGELAEFVLKVKTSFGWTIEKTASELRLSKGYISKLLSIAENPEILEKVKNGLLSLKEAYNEVSSFPGKQESQDAKHEKSPPTLTPIKEEKKQSLTDEDLGITTNLKQAIEEGKRFKPLGPEDLKPEGEPKKTEYMTCDFCGRILSRSDVKWIKVHSEEYDKVLLAIHALAERETQKESSQP